MQPWDQHWAFIYPEYEFMAKISPFYSTGLYCRHWWKRGSWLSHRMPVFFFVFLLFCTQSATRFEWFFFFFYFLLQPLVSKWPKPVQCVLSVFINQSALFISDIYVDQRPRWKFDALKCCTVREESLHLFPVVFVNEIVQGVCLKGAVSSLYRSQSTLVKIVNNVAVHVFRCRLSDFTFSPMRSIWKLTINRFLKNLESITKPWFSPCLILVLRWV